MKNAFIIILFTSLTFAGCKKDADSPKTPVVHSFVGIVEISTAGDKMGVWGTDDGDWSTDSSWSEQEYQILNFTDTVSLDNTYIEDTTGWNEGPGIHEHPQNFVIAYPNPANEQLTISYGGFGLLKFKVAIVDKYFNTLSAFAAKGHILPPLDVSDPTMFQNGSIYRMYYSLSVKDSVNFYKGHGDILICRESDVQACKKFVR